MTVLNSIHALESASTCPPRRVRFDLVPSTATVSVSEAVALVATVSVFAVPTASRTAPHVRRHRYPAAMKQPTSDTGSSISNVASIIILPTIVLMYAFCFLRSNKTRHRLPVGPEFRSSNSSRSRGSPVSLIAPVVHYRRRAYSYLLYCCG